MVKMKMADKKKILLAWAENGCKRPSQNGRYKELGKALVNYTIQSSTAYDPVFSERIRRMRPDWFTYGTVEKKRILLSMAASGEMRPGRDYVSQDGKRLGIALVNYTNPACLSFDPVFKSMIRQIQPLWFR